MNNCRVGVPGGEYTSLAKSTRATLTLKIPTYANIEPNSFMSHILFKRKRPQKKEERSAAQFVPTNKRSPRPENTSFTATDSKKD